MEKKEKVGCAFIVIGFSGTTEYMGVSSNVLLYLLLMYFYFSISSQLLLLYLVVKNSS